MLCTVHWVLFSSLCFIYPTNNKMWDNFKLTLNSIFFFGFERGRLACAWRNPQSRCTSVQELSFASIHAQLPLSRIQLLYHSSSICYLDKIELVHCGQHPFAICPPSCSLSTKILNPNMARFLCQLFHYATLYSTVCLSSCNTSWVLFVGWKRSELICANHFHLDVVASASMIVICLALKLFGRVVLL